MDEKIKCPVVAICYDFDKTLSPDDMQAQGFIQSVGYDVKAFWDKSNGLAKENEMDQNLAWMFEMKESSAGKTLFTRESLKAYGSKVQLFPGVEDWFVRMKRYGEEVGVTVEHYIISSGLREMIEGTAVSGEFKKIFASSFLFDKNDVAIWPAQVVNYTNKTQFLFRIEKGLLDVNDQRVNDHFAPDQLRVPFRNMVYIGDSDTDVPCMKLVNSYGGHSIGVYNAETNDKSKVYKMMRDGRIKYFVPADYTEGQELDCLVKDIIERTANNELLERKYYSYQKEVIENDRGKAIEDKTKTDLILALEDSRSFAQTHTIIGQMRKIQKWTKEEADHIAKIARANSQVCYIITDNDIASFFKRIIDGRSSEAIEELREALG
ncbi:MAG: HAD family hydrolase [Sphaerochaetaceae bacterium]